MAKKNSSDKTSGQSDFELALEAEESLKAEAAAQAPLAVAFPEPKGEAFLALDKGSEALGLLLSESSDKRALAESSDRSGSLLLAACRKGDVASVRHILAAGADPAAKSGPWKTPAITASTDHPEIVKVLIDAGADPSAQTDSGLCALTAALSRLDIPGSEKSFDILKKAGAKPASKASWPTILSAAGSGSAEAVEWCLANGSKISDTADTGSGVLHSLSRDPSLAVLAKRLVALGADPNLKNKEGLTPLHRCAENSNASLAASLVALGADPSALSASGHTPLDLAGDKESATAKIIKDAGGALSKEIRASITEKKAKAPSSKAKPAKKAAPSTVAETAKKAPKASAKKEKPAPKAKPKTSAKAAFSKLAGNLAAESKKPDAAGKKAAPKKAAPKKGR